MPPTIDTRKILFICKMESEQMEYFKQKSYLLLQDSPADLRNPMYVNEEEILSNSIVSPMLGPIGDKAIIYTIYDLIVSRYNLIKKEQNEAIFKERIKVFKKHVEDFLKTCFHKKINIIPLLDTMILSYFFQAENMKDNKKLIQIVSESIIKIMDIKTTL